MDGNERRTTPRKRVILGAKTSDGNNATTLTCTVRNLSDDGACLDFGHAQPLPGDMALSIASKGRDYATRVVWKRDNQAGVAFVGGSATPGEGSEVEDKLRDSERKERALRRRVRELTGG